MHTRTIDLPAQLAAMNKMTSTQLRARYAELFGERSRSGNRMWLLRRCAWRLQSLAEGGLSERAIKRAKELARDQDIRATAPRGMRMPPLDRPADVAEPAQRYIPRTPATGSHDHRLPMPGGQLKRVYKGHLYVVNVLENGFEYDGQRYHSLSAVAHAISGGHWNGFRFFNITDADADGRDSA
ncbi:MAG: DUF2924 domain-containing protein [Phycisphaeraceae bacterium]|nr:DUF2924 domain-containing protein [Phycisphaeraceae bacterium]